VDAADDLHFYDTESQYTPESLTESSENFWDLEIEESGDQIRTQIIALGPPAQLAGTHEDTWESPQGPYAGSTGAYDKDDPSDNTTLRVDPGGIGGFDWLYDGDGSAYTNYFLIGGELVEFDSTSNDPTYYMEDGGAQCKRILFSTHGVLDNDYEVGERVYPVLIKSSGDTARKTIEGGDGVHEYFVDLSEQPSMDSVETIVDGILSDYDASRVSGSYLTRDRNARAGGVVTVNLPNWYDHSSADYQIREQTTTWPESRVIMQRRVTFGNDEKSFEELLAETIKGK
jgi:hypothetical protein